MPRTSPRASLVCVLASALLLIAALHAAAEPPSRILLGGDIVTPQGVVAHGWLDIDHGRILRIQRDKPSVPNALALETRDLIFPGFIDLHNHPGFNIFPRWTPPHTFANRYQWRDWDVYRDQLERKGYALLGDPSLFCDIDEYAEVKALIGGTTSMIGFGEFDPGGQLPQCVEGLVRNLDHATGFYGPGQGRERIANSIGITPRDMPATVAARFARQLADGSLDLLTIHIAEGLPTDPESAQELDLLDAHGLLTPHTTLIHAVGLSPAQLARVRRAGASIVWSPRSNFELYGATANVDAAFRSGVPIALAPDWSPTGSSNMLDEIRYANQLSRTQLGGLFSTRQLVEMASGVPARIASIDDKVGALEPGMLADLVLLHQPANTGNPYDTLASSQAADIEMVMIAGVPVYGDPAMLRTLGARTEPLTVCRAERALNADALPNGNFSDVQQRLRTRMRALDTDLAPLAECAP